MKFLYDHYSNYLKKEYTELTFRFTYDLGDSVFLQRRIKSKTLTTMMEGLIMKLKATIIMIIKKVKYHCYYTS